ncbi:RING finger and SPRY domain-containing protein 1-like isoform X2 [Battus philenor]|uniref:RING finger and SPRY domain-containing protein 1-like isoform X2 n=1 Tax=Battus philenor TaxID=42288 RepID=UPI0035CF875B
MGSCWCKATMRNEEDVYGPSTSAEWPLTISCVDPSSKSPKIDSAVVDQLVKEMLSLISSFVDNDEESPVSLVKLHVIADKEEGWIQVISSLINVIPLEDPFGPSAITILLDDCPLPSKDSVVKVTKLFRLCAGRTRARDLNLRIERNICVVIGCMAEKMAGPNSVAIFTENTLDYLFSFLMSRQEACIVLFALIALEKFAHTTENKLTIKSRLEKEAENPLLVLETYADCDDFVWRQVGFCAKWALDNLFIVEGRKLSYELADMSNINVILNCQDVSEYLKISANGLEARCDSFSFESVRCTFQVDQGCWYYEALIVTPGVMQIGWATRNSHFLNHGPVALHRGDVARGVTGLPPLTDRTVRTRFPLARASVSMPREPVDRPIHWGYGIGDDLFSLSYDGCRRLIWYKARPMAITEVPPWQAGDVLGCLIDLDRKELIFSLNGAPLPPCKEIFEISRYGFFAAASFMAFQQCRFNFGNEPFSFPPTDRKFAAFNEFGQLTDEQKKVLPRRLYLEDLKCETVRDDSCTLCFDDTACCMLEPCGHGGFCSLCTSQLRECPMCRADIVNIRREDT